MSTVIDLEGIWESRQDLLDNSHLVLLNQVREQSLNSVLSEILDVEAHLRRIALMRLLEMTLPHSLGQKADQSKFAAGNRAC
jgi:hypothetical protein